MANEVRSEIRSLLDDDKSISTRVGTRLTLSMLTEMDDLLQNMNEKVSGLSQRVEVLEAGRKNDIEWIRNNFKTTIAIFILSVIAINEFQEYLLGAARKWLGLP